ncbi:MAG TPA: hypothetical protein VJI46_06875 [Candidatus Nanoarchaeia archaeon]|nr:hypothetical protein [Candidatus Nanoarchaeia archaeon]
MRKAMFVFLISAMLVLSLAGAQEEKEAKKNVMDANYLVISCRIDSTVSIINDVVAKVPEASTLSEHATVLNADKEQLASLKEGDARAYNDYRVQTYIPNQKAANKALVDTKKSFKTWGVSNEVQDELKASADTLKKSFGECKSGAVKDYGLGKVNGYNALLDELERKIASMKEKNAELDTTGMQKVVDDGRVFVDELEAAINAATNEEELKAAVKGYCIKNGCKDGKNFHIAAKFTHARLQAVLDVVKDEGNAEEVAKAQGFLDAAKAELDNVGLSHYTKEQRQAVWSNLKDAGKTIKGIINSLKEGEENE